MRKVVKSVGFRIQKEKATSALQTDIANLNDQSQRAETQVSTMESARPAEFDLAGSGYEAIGERITSRATIAKSHYVMFRRLAAADASNISALAQVEAFADDDSVDTDKCDQRIQAAYAEKDAISEEWKKALQWCFGYTDGVNHYFLGLLEAQDAIIENNERVKRKAQTYQSTVENIYWEAESLAGGMLESSTAATRSAVSGDYGSMDWASTVDCAYEATHAYSELIVDGELQEDKIRECFASEALSDAQIAALGMVFADLTTRSMGGDEEPLNTFLGLGYVESSRSGTKNYQEVWTVTVTYSALPGLLLAAQSWSDDSGLPTGANPNITNACDATGAALLLNATISCHGTGYSLQSVYPSPGPLVEVSFATHTTTDAAGAEKPFGIETIGFGTRINGAPTDTYYATYDAEASTNAANMVSYMADINIKDPVEEGMKETAISFISSVTGIPMDTNATGLAGEVFDWGVEFSGKAAGATGAAKLPYSAITATVDGVVKGYQVTQDNRTFVTIGNASQLSAYANDTFQTSGGVLCSPDNGVAVLAGSQTPEEAQRYADYVSGYEDYLKGEAEGEVGSKSYEDWLDEQKKEGDQR